MAQHVPSSYLDRCEPEARIEQSGRWAYSIVIVHGLLRIGPGPWGAWLAFGRAHAECKARRKLAQYRKEEERRKAAWTVQP